MIRRVAVALALVATALVDGDGHSAPAGAIAGRFVLVRERASESDCTDSPLLARTRPDDGCRKPDTGRRIKSRLRHLIL